MSPERINPSDPAQFDYDIRADVWSLGISLVSRRAGVNECAVSRLRTRLFVNESLYQLQISKLLLQRVHLSDARMER